jgi:thymidine kinase
MESGSIEIITGPMQSGKCHGKGTMILMATGLTKEVEKIVVGDNIMGANSNICVVYSVTKGRGEMFRVNQSKANSYTVNLDHVLSLRNVQGEVVNVSVNNYSLLSKEFKDKYFGYSNVVNYPYAGIPSESEIDEAYVKGFYGIDPLEDEYLYSSLITRMFLFVGIMEKNAVNQVVESTGQTVICIHVFLNDYFDDHRLITLIKSLGLIVRKMEIPRQYLGYNLIIYGNELPYFPWIKWKESIKSGNFDPYSRLSTLSIEPIGIDDFYGFTIEGTNHLYMLEDFTVTHNTTELIRRTLCDASVKRKVLFINSALDTRSPEIFSTHNLLYDGQKMKHPNVTPLKVYELPHLDQVEQYHTICIDEAQFFPDLSLVVDYAEKLNKRVIVSGLTGDYLRNNFGNILTLATKANKFNLLCASCIKCAEEGSIYAVNAHFTHRTSDNTNQIDVGGQEEYIPVCRKHYILLNKEK